MNKRKYRVYNDSAGLREGVPPLTLEEEERELHYLPSELSQHFGDEVKVDTQVASDEVGGGLYVTLESSGNGDDLDDSLAACLVKLNDRKGIAYGLCFLVERID